MKWLVCYDELNLPCRCSVDAGGLRNCRERTTRLSDSEHAGSPSACLERRPGEPGAARCALLGSGGGIHRRRKTPSVDVSQLYRESELESRTRDDGALQSVGRPEHALCDDPSRTRRLLPRGGWYTGDATT